MKRVALLVFVGAVAMAGCGTGAGQAAQTVVDAGPALDAGRIYASASVGVVTFTGAVTGTADAIGLASYTPEPLQFADGGNSGGYVSFDFVDTGDYQSNPVFGCTFFLFSTAALPTGILTAPDVDSLSCLVGIQDGGTQEFWGNVNPAPLPPASTFVLNITSVARSKPSRRETFSGSTRASRSTCTWHPAMAKPKALASA